MRAVFGALSLLVVVAIVALLARKQLGTADPVAVPASAPEGSVVRPAGPPQQQVQQFQKSVQDAMQPARVMPEEK